MEWNDDDKEALINNLMDTASNLDRIRNLIIISVDDDGSMQVVRRRKPNASAVELIGMLQVCIRDEQRGLDEWWSESERPIRGED